jgi:predicted  nucleic acid-binding Zn-ribbon protein
MAEPFDTLMQVQSHDTTLDQLRHRMETLPERRELAAVQQQLDTLAEATAEVQAQVNDLAQRQELLEELTAASAQRRHDIEERMRSGQVSASRDLQAMDQEAQHLAARQAQLEEEEILLLEEEDPLDSQLEEYLEDARHLTEDVNRLEAAITAAEAEIRSLIGAEEGQRADVAAGLPPDLAQRYEVLRSHLGGVGAARLVGNRCDGCHLTLSSVEIERIHHLPPEEFATCAQCDRILVH